LAGGEIKLAAIAARTAETLASDNPGYRPSPPRPRTPVAGWESLTETERTASELVAQGLNNRQIASRMYVSVNTVAFYMRQIFRKLNIGSRTGLARIVVQQNTANPAGPGGQHRQTW
jgi:DNA-binding CsgD family transcriptional regulator